MSRQTSLVAESGGSETCHFPLRAETTVKVSDNLGWKGAQARVGPVARHCTCSRAIHLRAYTHLARLDDACDIIPNCSRRDKPDYGAFDSSLAASVSVYARLSYTIYLDYAAATALGKQRWRESNTTQASSSPTSCKTAHLFYHR